MNIQRRHEHKCHFDPQQNTIPSRWLLTTQIQSANVCGYRDHPWVSWRDNCTIYLETFTLVWAPSAVVITSPGQNIGQCQWPIQVVVWFVRTPLCFSSLLRVKPNLQNIVLPSFTLVNLQKIPASGRQARPTVWPAHQPSHAHWPTYVTVSRLRIETMALPKIRQVQ